MEVSPVREQPSHIGRTRNDPGPSASGSDTDLSTTNSRTITPLGSSTPTGTVLVPSRDRSGTIIARTVWDAPAAQAHTHTHTRNTNQTMTTTAGPSRTTVHHHHTHHRRNQDTPSPGHSSGNSRPETETEDDGDVEMENADNNRSHINASASHTTGIDSDITSASASPSPERPPHHRLPLARRTVGIVSDAPDPTGLQVTNLNMAGMPLTGDAHIMINDVGAVGGGTVGVEDGIVSLDQNDDFAMGAPPGAPGAMDQGTTPRVLNLTVEAQAGARRRMVNDAPDVTPRAGVISLPPSTAPIPAPLPSPGAAPATTGYIPQAPLGHQRSDTIRAGTNQFTGPTLLQATRQPPAGQANAGQPVMPTTAEPANTAVGRTAGIAIPPSIPPANAAGPILPTTTAAHNTTNHPRITLTITGRRASSNGSHHHRSDNESTGPYRDEDVLLSLQLLAYLSKYPHVRQAFYKPRVTFHPASIDQPGGRYTVLPRGGIVAAAAAEAAAKSASASGSYQLYGSSSRGKEKAAAGPPSSSAGVSSSSVPTPGILSTASSSSSSSSGVQPSSSVTVVPVAPSHSSSASSSSTSTPQPTQAPVRQTNVFSLVERFTFRPSSTEVDSAPRLPQEIQYWAGVIMRNACRKDESRGGIRQCANSKF